MISNLSVCRYRRLNLDVDAICFMQENQVDVADWCGGLLTVIPRENDDSHAELVIYIKAPNGESIARLGDYIIEISDGEFYACDPKTFHETFKLAGDGTH